MCGYVVCLVTPILCLTWCIQQCFPGTQLCGLFTVRKRCTCLLCLCSAYACLQAVLLVRIEALTSLLQQAVAESQQQPHLPLPFLAITFATTQVQVRIQLHSSAVTLLYFRVWLAG